MTMDPTRPVRPPESALDILCFGTDWYSPSRVSIVQIVDELRRRGSRVLWINPIPIRFPNARKKAFWGKVQAKAKTHARFLHKQEDGFWVYSPIYLPVYKSPGFFLNRWLVSLQVMVLRLLLGFRQPLVLGSAFTAWFGRPAIGRSPMWFHFADKISAFREVADQPDRRRVLEKMEREIVQASRVCTCSSRAILEHVQALAEGTSAQVLYLPHAVDAHRFPLDGTGESVGPAPELVGLPRPIAGYFGSLTATNDQDTFMHAARKLADWSFVFVGRVAGDYEELDSLPNVHFLGPMPHERIPQLGSEFDVCFMGWKAHEWISNCFPLKTLEYLALGKPIVCSSRIDEIVERFNDLVITTDSAGAFTDALVQEQRLDGLERAERRRTAVARETWEHRVDEVLDALARPGPDHAS